MEKSGKVEGQERDIAGLSRVGHFGWLRSPELGFLLWPGTAHARKLAERLTRKWAAKGLVIARPLPNAGSAFVLSQGGADFLKGHGIEAKSGKDWGETKAGAWITPAWWRHDLMAAGVLCRMVAAGWDALPERQIRRENPGIAKIPDGLALSPDGAVLWLEVESARKSGKAMDDMAKALIRVSAGKAPALSGHIATLGAIAYRKDARDERGYRLNHGPRVIAGIKKQALVDVELVFFGLEMSGEGVRSGDDEIVQIEADAVARKVARMRELGWRTRTDLPGVTSCVLGDDLLARYILRDETWFWELLDCRDPRPEHEKHFTQQSVPKVVASGTACGPEECKRRLAEAWPYDDTV